jgi:signal transduction histidine kinase
MGRPLEPGLVRIFRYFAGIAFIYFAILWGYGIISPHPSVTLQIQSLMNLPTSSCLFVYLSLPWLERHLKKWYLPIALVTYSVATVFSNLIYLFDPNTDLYIIIARSWALIPILLVPLVLIAWQYSFSAVLAFTIFTNATELLILFLVVKKVTFETLPILGLPVIRAFAFGTVGYIVERLMDIQRTQKRKLIMANIQLGQYANTLESLAISRERNRLARELHDTLAHTLSGVSVNLEAIKTMLTPGQGDVEAMLDHSLTATRQGLEETRRTLQDLRAKPLEDLGLELALRTLVKVLADREAIETEVEFSPNLPTLPPDVEQSIYRITQEALENIAKHADARHVSLSMEASGKRVTLTIEDDGKGLNLKNSPVEGQFGIKGMRERAAVVGGTLTVGSRPGYGTTIRFVWERLDDQSPDL